MQSKLPALLVTLILVTSCRQNLYVIVNRDENVRGGFPTVYISKYENGKQEADACFLSRKVNLFSPYCFSSSDKVPGNIQNLRQIRGEIWNQDDLDNFFADVYSDELHQKTVTTYDLKSCNGLLSRFGKVFILIKEKGYYKKFLVDRCTSFEE